MRKDITVYSDDLEVSIQTNGTGSYTLKHGEFSSLELSESQLRELQQMIEEILQHTNKRDW